MALAGRPIVHNSTRIGSMPRIANIPCQRTTCSQRFTPQQGAKPTHTYTRSLLSFPYSIISITFHPCNFAFNSVDEISGVRGRYTTSHKSFRKSNFPFQSSPITNMSMLLSITSWRFCSHESSKRTLSTHLSAPTISARCQSGIAHFFCSSSQLQRSLDTTTVSVPFSPPKALALCKSFKCPI